MEINVNKFYVYHLWYDDVIIYIGQTKNVFLRITQHKNKPFNRVVIKEYNTIEEVLMEEKIQISKYNPPFNWNQNTIAISGNRCIFMHHGETFDITTDDGIVAAKDELFYFDGEYLQSIKDVNHESLSYKFGLNFNYILKKLKSNPKSSVIENNKLIII